MYLKVQVLKYKYKYLPNSAPNDAILNWNFGNGCPRRHARGGILQIWIYIMLNKAL